MRPGMAGAHRGGGRKLNMNETLLIAKVRKETTVTVPAGGFVILAGPEKAVADQLAMRAKMLSKGTVSEDYETLSIGRLRSSHPDAKFVTSAQKKKAEEQFKAAEASMSESNKQAAARQKKLDAEAAEQAQKAHAAKVAEINKENDAIRNRK